jgi:hypothetical protein
VTILACDPECPGLPARMACWVRDWPEGQDYPRYRSCELSDLDMSDEDRVRLPTLAAALSSALVTIRSSIPGYLKKKMTAEEFALTVIGAADSAMVNKALEKGR